MRRNLIEKAIATLSEEEKILFLIRVLDDRDAFGLSDDDASKLQEIIRQYEEKTK